MSSIRIGIDVGGTFTDAVAIDEATHDLVDHVKVPTTHQAAEGVALGIVQALQKLLDKAGIDSADVRFIAHGTTQATNALLEGDVAQVGIVATAKGAVDAIRARSETNIGDIELAPGRFLKTHHAFVAPEEATGTPLSGGEGRGERLTKAIDDLRQQGARAIVAAETFSVDNPEGEQAIVDVAVELGLPATATHEISKLYGLRMRTRTAVVNASIMPKMLSTADMTEDAIVRTGIAAPLMIMRCDGGVMNLDEVRKRPIMTLLSGPAAGVAGALIYEKIVDGLFLEVGGTSTDISAVKNGRVVVEYAEVGGNKTYVRSLDVHTVGVAGGSMARFDPASKKIREVGPRSAHIAGLDYSTYADPADIVDPQLELFAPQPGDPADYLCIRCCDRRYALTTACAANVLGFAKPGDYAHGSKEAAIRAFAPLASAMGTTVDEAAREFLRAAAKKLTPVVKGLIEQYSLTISPLPSEERVGSGNKALSESSYLPSPERGTSESGRGAGGEGPTVRGNELVGGGGGAAAIVPFLAESLGMRWRLARNHQVISPIGVALALVRDSVERTIANPTQDDLLRVRKEAEEAALRSGAAPGTITVHVEVDPTRNLVRATAAGATEMQMRDSARKELPEPELRALAAASLDVDAAALVVEASTESWHVYSAKRETKALFGLMRRSTTEYRVLDSEGTVRLSAPSMQVTPSTAGNFRTAMQRAVDQSTVHGDAGAVLPRTYILCGREMVDLSGLPTYDQMTGLASTSLAGYTPEEPIIILCIKGSF